MDILTQEYCEMYDKYPGEADMGVMRKHLFQFLYQGLIEHTDLRTALGSAKSVEAII